MDPSLQESLKPKTSERPVDKKTDVDVGPAPVTAASTEPQNMNS